ncbi:leucine-rich repeat domain-containing protein [Spirosoma aureum]|uniref:Leucine-rich repeat domain-containing protein n=1 Tax=Spirosoma aureum TaxID=2692134 RepID=A0A6G9ASG0_9BACT|nr:leucine-rich repeat domain-containing protein [Spirosoma aureum]QIP15411.1 leucine-rich repeat domain-containing protein [Spirosoma aureum]
MKNLLLFLLFSGFALSGRAQVKVILLRDTTTYQVSQATLAKKYPALSELLKAKPQGAFTVMQKQAKQLDEFVKKRNDIPQKGFYLHLHEYYQSDGKAQWVLVNTDRPQPDSIMAKAIKALEEFYSTTSYPASGNVPFRTMSVMLYGKSFIAPRTVRRGAGIISTLEAAEKTTRPDTVKMLAFNQLDLGAVPEIVYRFPKLEELDLSKNALHELPARLTADIPTLKRLSLLYNVIPDDSVFITRNKHLQALNLQGNRLTQVPTSIRKNRRLESLWLGNNKLKELDGKTLRRLHQLNDLNLYNAGLTQLPKTIGKLKHVRVMDLYYNKLTELPRQIGRMKRLEQLAVAHNDLKELPPSLTKLRRLQVLYAHHNRISQLPDSYQKMTYLTILDLGYNWFSVAPEVLAALPSLEELDLSNNNLQELPRSLGESKRLKKLYLRSNPLSGTNAKSGPYAPIIQQLEANKTEVFY